MRIAVTAFTLLFALVACSTNKQTTSPYQQPNALMETEINQRIDQIAFQHREELVQNLLWLAQTGEQTIPALLRGLNSEDPKVRSSCCWVLGRLRDRRTVNDLRGLVDDEESSVALEAARALVLMGDLDPSPRLIEGLDSDRKEVRYMCHEALKSATGHDFGYDHLNPNPRDLKIAVLRWRQWWGEYGGDTFFASSYEQENGLGNLAAPGGETKPEGSSSSDGQTESSESSESTTPDTQSNGGANNPESSAPDATTAPAVIPVSPANSNAGAETGEQGGVTTSEGEGEGSSSCVVACPDVVKISFLPRRADGTTGSGEAAFTFTYEVEDEQHLEVIKKATAAKITQNFEQARQAVLAYLNEAAVDSLTTEAGKGEAASAIVEILNANFFATPPASAKVTAVSWQVLTAQ